MEIEKEKIDFKYLFKVVKIELDIVTFKKYKITKNSSLVSKPGIEVVDIGEEVGTETHKVTPELLEELIGNTGMIVKSLVAKAVGKKNKKVLVSKVIKPDEQRNE